MIKLRYLLSILVVVSGCAKSPMDRRDQMPEHGKEALSMLCFGSADSEISVQDIAGYSVFHGSDTEFCSLLIQRGNQFMTWHREGFSLNIGPDSGIGGLDKDGDGYLDVIDYTIRDEEDRVWDAQDVNMDGLADYLYRGSGDQARAKVRIIVDWFDYKVENEIPMALVDGTWRRLLGSPGSQRLDENVE